MSICIIYDLSRNCIDQYETLPQKKEAACTDNLGNSKNGNKQIK